MIICCTSQGYGTTFTEAGTIYGVNNPDKQSLVKIVYYIANIRYCTARSKGDYEAKDHTTVLLGIPPSSPYRKDIEYALRRVNERHIFDYFGRKLWIEI